MHVECSSDASNCLTLSKKLRRNPNLIRVQFSRASEADTAQLGGITTSPSALANQIPFELGYAGEHGHDHLLTWPPALQKGIALRSGMATGLRNGRFPTIAKLG